MATLPRGICRLDTCLGIARWVHWFAVAVCGSLYSSFDASFFGFIYDAICFAELLIDNGYPLCELEEGHLNGSNFGARDLQIGEVFENCKVGSLMCYFLFSSHGCIVTRLIFRCYL